MAPAAPTPPERTSDGVPTKVLVVGPDAARLTALSRRLEALGLSCDTALATPSALRGGLLRAPDVVAAIEVAGAWQPSRALIASDMAQLGCLAPPVLVISDGVSPEERAEALAFTGDGVCDWVEVSAPDREIASRLARLARWRRQALELEDLRRRCAELDTLDRLTGLPNHRALQEYLTAEFRRAERYQSPLSLVLIDIDRFRSLNDTHGHLWGDRILQAVARSLRSVVREVDMAARYGGEEFALLLPETDTKAALAVAERARAAVDELGARMSESARSTGPLEGPSRITVSIGVATWPDEGAATRGLLLAGAESALRRAKDEGRNRTVVHAAGAAPSSARHDGAGKPAAAADGTDGGWSG